MTSCVHKMCKRHLVYTTSHLSFVAFYSYLVSWLAMIWACTYYTHFTDGWFLIREIGITCPCSDHGQPRYQIWIKCDKRQMTRCVHKMCERTYGQTNMKRAITLTKFNHPLIRFIALFMFVWPYIRSHILCTQLVICLLSHFIHIRYLDWPWSEHAHIIPISQMVDFCKSYSPFHVCLTIHPFTHLVYATSHLSIKIPNMNKMWQKTND
jgi:hypothetical protein